MVKCGKQIFPQFQKDFLSYCQLWIKSFFWGGGGGFIQLTLQHSLSSEAPCAPTKNKTTTKKSEETLYACGFVYLCTEKSWFNSNQICHIFLSSREPTSSTGDHWPHLSYQNKRNTSETSPDRWLCSSAIEMPLLSLLSILSFIMILCLLPHLFLSLSLCLFVCPSISVCPFPVSLCLLLSLSLFILSLSSCLTLYPKNTHWILS